MKPLTLLLLILAMASGCAEIAPPGQPPAPPQPAARVLPPRQKTRVMAYAPSEACKDCHTNVHEQQALSMHAQSYTNPVFQAQYFRDVLPMTLEGPRFVQEAQSCAACHMPVAHQRNPGRVIIGKHVDPQSSGVTCDLCHRISGFRGAAPENGNFIASPGEEKYGPFRHSSSWHHVYLEFQTTSEFCAVCHESVNTLGVRAKPTYSEWKASPYAASGIQCQDCHMNAKGYLIDHKAQYESGKAAEMTLGTAPERSRLYSHRFPGARTQTQLDNAIPLRLRTERAEAAPGEDLAITVEVDNERTGHRMPSGSIELRTVWLDLEARVGGRRIAIPAPSAPDSAGYDVGGAVPADRAALGEAFPQGKRVYRAVFVDAAGNQTQSMVEAARKVFDNRLDPGKVRTERYTWRVPQDVQGKVTLVARLYYLAYPQAFATRLELPRAPNTLISTGELEIAVRSAR